MTQLELWKDFAVPEETETNASECGKDKPELKLFVNQNDESIAEHRLARCIYAETLGSSLPAIESLCVMVMNTGRAFAEIAEDESVFESLDKKSVRNKHLLVDYNDAGFQLCLRTVKKMQKSLLADKIFGATKFHRADGNPEWANSIGSVAEIDGLFFYL